MFSLNYFQLLCFTWGILGLASRGAMWVLGPRWKAWEMEQAYSAERPPWVMAVILGGAALAGWTWYQVWLVHTPYGWIMGAAISLTLVKLRALLLRYDDFRVFAKTVLHSPRKFAALNIGVSAASVILILMGVLLY